MTLFPLLKLCIFAFCLIVNGKVVEINNENFESTVGDGLWLLDFYAPWCGHCKNLFPILEEFSSTQSEMQVGKIDVTINRGLGSKFGVKSYPTIIYKKGSTEGVYKGPRSLEGFVGLFEKLSKDPIIHIESHDFNSDSLHHFFSDGLIVYVLTTIDKVTTSFDIDTTSFVKFPDGQRAISDFHTTATKRHAEAHFASTVKESSYETSEALNAICIIKVEVGKKNSLKMLNSGFNMEQNCDQKCMEKFVEESNHHLVNNFDSHNFKQLGSLGRLLMISIADPKNSEHVAHVDQALDQFISSLSAKDADMLIFGHLDGVRWARFLKQYDASAPGILILDFVKDLHHTTSFSRNKIEITAVKETMVDLFNLIKDGHLDMEESHSDSIVMKIVRKFKTYYPWSFIVAAIPVILMTVSYFITYPSEKSVKKD